MKESVRVKSQRIKNTTGEKALRKNLLRLRDKGCRRWAGIRKKNQLTFRIESRNVVEKKVGFKVDSEIKRDTEREAH